MANFRGEGGVDVTDEMLDKWESDAEKGIYHGKAGNLRIKKPLGRPPIYKEAMLPITFRISAEDAEDWRCCARSMQTASCSKSKMITKCCDCKVLRLRAD